MSELFLLVRDFQHIDTGMFSVNLTEMLLLGNNVSFRNTPLKEFEFLHNVHFRENSSLDVFCGYLSDFHSLFFCILFFLITSFP